MFSLSITYLNNHLDILLKVATRYQPLAGNPSGASRVTASSRSVNALKSGHTKRAPILKAMMEKPTDLLLFGYPFYDFSDLISSDGLLLVDKY
ncbi:MAG: hypothetical protein U5K79_04790 [Cyclobacteriaceae bacterium]|nr:hypothetical protein [Cyclobacteriaceae bacterium]